MKYILLSILFSNTLFALTPRDQKILTLLKGEIKMIKNVKKKKSKRLQTITKQMKRLKKKLKSM